MSRMAGLAALLLLLLASPSTPAEAQASAAGAVNRDEVLGVLNLLKAGKGQEAVDAVMGSSPLYAHKAGLREALVGQIEGAFQSYGPVSAYELVATENIGSMVQRQLYIVQHRHMVVRWEFHLVRTGSGWRIGHFGFNDQVPTWFGKAE